MQGKLLQFKSKSPVARREKAESRRQEGQRQVEDSNPSTKVDLASFSGDLALATPVLSVFTVFLFFSVFTEDCVHIFWLHTSQFKCNSLNYGERSKCVYVSFNKKLDRCQFLSISGHSKSETYTFEETNSSLWSVNLRALCRRHMECYCQPLACHW